MVLYKSVYYYAITCTDTDNSKQTRENTPKTQKETTKTNKLALGKKNTQNTQNT